MGKAHVNRVTHEPVDIADMTPVFQRMPSINGAYIGTRQADNVHGILATIVYTKLATTTARQCPTTKN